jgi:hypothetical protein
MLDSQAEFRFMELAVIITGKNNTLLVNMSQRNLTYIYIYIHINKVERTEVSGEIWPIGN